MAGSRRALFSIVAMMAMLLSAGGIAYMASVSYPDELGIVDARVREIQERSVQIADGLRAHVDQHLAQLREQGTERRSSMDEAVFILDAGGVLIQPSLEPLRMAARGDLEGLLPMKGFQARQRSLLKARESEAGGCSPGKAGCTPNAAMQKSAAALYEGVSKFSDTGAEALLGLARLHRGKKEDDLAASRYRELAQRFGKLVNESGVPYRLLADIGLSEVSRTPPATFELLRNLMARQYEAPNALLEVAAYSAIGLLADLALDPAQEGELKALSEAFTAAQAETVFAQRLSSRLDEVQRSASSESKSLVAPWDSSLNLVYQRGPEGGVLGVVMSEARFEELALQTAKEVGLASSLSVSLRRMDEEAALDPRRQARASLGPLLPHLAIVLWDEGKGSDAMRDIAAARRRHQAITGGLVVVLVLGLFATVRGAARERELARLKSDFVTTVSHELKTPLTSIRMFAEMLQQGVAGADREKEAHYHTIIVKESERLGLLIANLLDYSQIERGTRQYTDQSEKVLDIAREAQETFARLREGEGQELQVSVASDAEDLVVNVDREVMVQCLLNLLSNAAKYGGDSAIDMSVQSGNDDGVVEFSVKDSGPGIPSSEQERVFREFYRAPEAVSSAIEGTGLGLALVKRHVEAQGGEIELFSELGGGATFTIRLQAEEA
jgi:signal transduction histidine kinase